MVAKEEHTLVPEVRLGVPDHFPHKRKGSEGGIWTQDLSEINFMEITEERSRSVV